MLSVCLSVELACSPEAARATEQALQAVLVLIRTVFGTYERLVSLFLTGEKVDHSLWF